MEEEEEELFNENDIENKEYYKGIKSMVNCSICLYIIEDPVQCNKCQHFFCSKCVKNLNLCPFRCENNTYIPALVCKQLISELKIKCVCGKVLQYDFFRKHKEEECEKADFKKSYFKLKKKYELLKEELNKIKNEEYEIKNSYFIMSSLHCHPIEIIKRFINEWFCDVCHKYFNETIPSYHCSLCDFDVCYNCVKTKVTKGKIKEEMKDVYEKMED